MKQILKGGAIVYLCVLALTVPNENAIQLTATVVCHANRWARAIPADVSQFGSDD